jgi:hypothetical protein
MPFEEIVTVYTSGSHHAIPALWKIIRRRARRASGSSSASRTIQNGLKPFWMNQIAHYDLPGWRRLESVGRPKKLLNFLLDTARRVAESAQDLLSGLRRRYIRA